MATNYPFRPGASKTVILVPCRGCAEGNVTRWEVERDLQRKDIQFHVLMDYDFMLKDQGRNESPKSSEIYGKWPCVCVGLYACIIPELITDNYISQT